QNGVVCIASSARPCRTRRLYRVFPAKILVDAKTEARLFGRAHKAVAVDPDLRFDDAAEALIGLDRPRRRLVHHFDPSGSEARRAACEVNRRGQAEPAQPMMRNEMPIARLAQRSDLAQLGNALG